VLQWERVDIKEEWLHLMEWGSRLNERTTSEKEKAVVKWERLSKMEAMLKQEEVTIILLNAEEQELVEKDKELCATAEAHADANIKT
jgi:hypothetical protein